MTRNRDTATIIVAGGKGLRFGGRVRKQYLRLKGHPILWWSLQAFEKSPSVLSLTLVVPEDDVARVRAQVRRWKLKKLFAVVRGGTTRADSVRAGLPAVPESCRYVAVHDAVRPLVLPKTIERVIQAARRSKAALAACPSKDTVKLSNGGGYIHSTPSREKVWLAQTPQVFERGLLERAHREWGQTPRSKRGLTPFPTDDAMLVERLGVKVKLVESPAENIKVTHPMDLEMAKCIASA